MKKYYLLMAAALLLAMPSCKKDPQGGGKEEEPETARVLEDFENGGILTWTGADGCDFAVVDNPSKTGNESAKVGKYTTSANMWDFVWTTGFGAKDDTFDFLDFDKDGYVIKVDVYAPAAGIPIFCKLEGVGVDSKEVGYKDAPNKIPYVQTTKANAWETLEFDFEPLGVVNGAYKNFVFCVDAGGETNGTVVYLDNVRQVK